jgi:dynactin complex subunit
MKKGDLVEITWDDAIKPLDEMWASEEEFNAAIGKNDNGEIKSVGYFHKKTKERIYIYADFDIGLIKYSRITGIPNGVIRKIKTLKVK